MGPENISISAAGGNFTATESIEVDAAFDGAARAFKLEIAASPNAQAAAAAFAGGTEISISANGDLLVTGYIDRFQPVLKGKGTSIIYVAGRSKAQDAIDCSAIHETGRFDNQTILQIAQTLDRFGIGFSTDQDLAPIPYYQLTPGETVFRALERLCRQEGYVLAGQPNGSVLITKLSTQTQAPLMDGVNCKELAGDHNWAARHSVILARGQRAIGTGDDNLQIEAQAADAAVTRYRPFVLVIDGDTDQARAQKAAQTRLAQEAGHALRAVAVVQGFHDDKGKLWTPGNLVWVESPFLGLQQNMAVKHVKYVQNRKTGSEARLTLCDPQAFGGVSSQAGSSDGGWSTDAGD